MHYEAPSFKNKSHMRASIELTQTLHVQVYHPFKVPFHPSGS